MKLISMDQKNGWIKKKIGKRNKILFCAFKNHIRQFKQIFSVDIYDNSKMFVLLTVLFSNKTFPCFKPIIYHVDKNLYRSIRRLLRNIPARIYPNRFKVPSKFDLLLPIWGPIFLRLSPSFYHREYPNQILKKKKKEEGLSVRRCDVVRRHEIHPPSPLIYLLQEYRR